jgi:hypothetical protein
VGAHAPAGWAQQEALHRQTHRCEYGIAAVL